MPATGLVPVEDTFVNYLRQTEIGAVERNQRLATRTHTLNKRGKFSGVPFVLPLCLELPESLTPYRVVLRKISIRKTR